MMDILSGFKVIIFLVKISSLVTSRKYSPKSQKYFIIGKIFKNHILTHAFGVGSDVTSHKTSSGLFLDVASPVIPF